jgi:glycosyltransferase involved in cell wall biosynthesis
MLLFRLATNASFSPVSWNGRRNALIFHASGDEGSEYAAFLKEYIQLLEVRVRFAEDTFSHKRGQTSDGRKIYSLADAYQPAVLVTYPSTIEGFGNAFLEAIYHRKPIVMSTYEIYRIDIQPKGFKVVEFGDYITEDTVLWARELLENPDLVAEVVEHNYETARQYYSYANLERVLAALVSLSVGD